jgi:hypothetical protein
MEKDKKKIIAGVGILGGVGLLYLLMRRGGAAPPEGPPGGSVKCIGTDLYAWVNDQWLLQESNSPACESNPDLECLVDTDCPPGSRCVNGICIP